MFDAVPQDGNIEVDEKTDCPASELLGPHAPMMRAVSSFMPLHLRVLCASAVIQVSALAAA